MNDGDLLRNRLGFCELQLSGVKIGIIESYVNIKDTKWIMQIYLATEVGFSYL